MTPLLYLVHRIPYPPNKGDKIRSYHILRYLRERYRVYLGAFVDAEEDRAYVEDVSALCEEAFLPFLDPRAAKLASLSGFVSGAALTLPYYYRRQMQAWVDRVIGEQRVERTVIFSSAMAQYVSGDKYAAVTRVVDFVDVDSDKWRQYGASMRWPWSWVYGREGAALLAYEEKIAQEFDFSTFVSSAEADYFKSLVSVDGRKVVPFPNGVDLDYYNPAPGSPNPYPQGRQAIVFTGAMDYWANIDAVVWFAEKVFPLIRRRNGDAFFYIVGSKPDPKVQSLAGEGVVVTGRVPDVRPWLLYASAAVAPLRIARGIQNKVLEAMAMGRPVFASPQAAEGISAVNGSELIVEGDPGRLAEEIVQHLATGKYGDVGRRGREMVSREYTWSGSLDILGECLERGHG